MSEYVDGMNIEIVDGYIVVDKVRGARVRSIEDWTFGPNRYGMYPFGHVEIELSSTEARTMAQMLITAADEIDAAPPTLSQLIERQPFQLP